MRVRKWVSCWLACAVIGMAGVGSDAAAMGDSERGGAEASQTGYFKSDARDRVLAYQSIEPLTETAVREIVDRQTLTAGRVARFVFYSGQVSGPKDALTLAPSLQDALELTVTPPFDAWDWLVMINPAGEVTLRARPGL